MFGMKFGDTPAAQGGSVPQGGMSSAMASMLKMLGVDPNEITETITGYGKTINAFAVKLNSIEAFLANIDDKLNVLIQERKTNGEEYGGSGSGSGNGV